MCHEIKLKGTGERNGFNSIRTYAKRQNPPPQSPPKGGKFHSLALWERVGVRVLRKSYQLYFNRYSGYSRKEIAFLEMIQRMRKNATATEDISYIGREEEMWAEIERWQKELYQEGVIDGYKEGWREGFEEGKTQARMVKGMAENGIARADIAKITKLSMTEIEQILASSLNVS